MTVAATLEEIRILRHMVGAEQPPRNRGFRNYFACYADGDKFKELKSMESKGLVEQYVKAVEGMCYFRATALGCEFTGMEKAAQRRALGA